jgi:hypothetical protein
VKGYRLEIPAHNCPVCKELHSRPWATCGTNRCRQKWRWRLKNWARAEKEKLARVERDRELAAERIASARIEKVRARQVRAEALNDRAVEKAQVEAGIMPMPPKVSLRNITHEA